MQAYPFTLTCLALSIIGGVLLMIWLRRRSGDVYRRCRKCNYIVDNLPGTTCPECGSNLAIVGVREPWSSIHASRLRRWGLFIAWGIPTGIMLYLVGALLDDSLGATRYDHFVTWYGDQFRRSGGSVQFGIVRGTSLTNALSGKSPTDFLLVELVPRNGTAGVGYAYPHDLLRDRQLTAFAVEIATGAAKSRANAGAPVTESLAVDWRPAFRNWLVAALGSNVDPSAVADSCKLVDAAVARPTFDKLSDGFGFTHQTTWTTHASFESPKRKLLEGLAFWLKRGPFSAFLLVNVVTSIWLEIRLRSKATTLPRE